MSIAGDFPCKICLMDTQLKDMITLQQCGCMFCKEVRLAIYEICWVSWRVSHLFL